MTKNTNGANNNRIEIMKMQKIIKKTVANYDSCKILTMIKNIQIMDMMKMLEMMNMKNLF